MKVNFTNKSDIRLGYEIECCIRNSDNMIINHNFRKKILNLKVQIGNDDSIRPERVSDISVELRTPPLPPKDSIVLLEKVFNIVNEYGYTNKSCGFHVNISSKQKTKMKKFNPFPFISSRIWNDILKKFNREKNRFCRPVLPKTKTSYVNIICNLGYQFEDEKYHCVNLSNFGRGTESDSRIEIRGMGNVNYSKKLKLITEYIKKIENLFKYSCEVPLFTPPRI